MASSSSLSVTPDMAQEALVAKLDSLQLDAPSSSAAAPESVSPPRRPPLRRRRLRAPAHVDLPFELLVSILSHVAPYSPLAVLLLSKSLRSALEPFAYAHITIVDRTSLKSFHSLIEARPEVARRVRSLWIAPISLGSDLIPMVATKTSTQGLTEVRPILRACRKLRHLALDGAFLTMSSAASYGTASKPVSLLSVNPLSFLGAYSTPFLSKCRRLEIVDTSLAHEEVDEIRGMKELRHLTWTTPRDRSDVERDVGILLRIISPRAGQFSIASTSSTNEGGSGPPTFELPGSISPPERSSKAVHLRHLVFKTARGRAAEAGSKLQRVVHQGEELLGSLGNLSHGRSDAYRRAADKAAVGTTTKYVDSKAARTSVLVEGSGAYVHTRPLVLRGYGLSSSEGSGVPASSASDADDVDDDDDEDGLDMIQEWEALRDRLCGAVPFDPYSLRKSRPPSPGEVEGGNALRRVWIDWRERLLSGRLDGDEEGEEG